MIKEITAQFLPASMPEEPKKIMHVNRNTFCNAALMF